MRPGQSGQVLFDGVDFYRHYDQLRSLLGYVPQDDIVHAELTVAQAMRFSARLRLPGETPAFEIEKLVDRTIDQLGLAPRRQTPIARLSGGQRKRVSVGVELLGSPAVLFLDEPTSGLDPAAESKLMALLRDIARGGCTVACTTHVMENVYLTDRLFVVAGGQIVFSGKSDDAKEHFAIQHLTELYDRLDERPAAEWRERFVRSPFAPDDNPALPSGGQPVERPRFKPQRSKSNLGNLMLRQWTILASDWKNFLILFGQPLLIALLVAWLAAEPQIYIPTPTTITLFFAYLATLWFGTSNAAQEIVRELPIYRRERMVGLGRHTYLLSKFVFFGLLTIMQGAFLYGCLCVVEGKSLVGSPPWQIAAVFCTALAGVGIGFAISAFCRTTMQAVMVVPLVLIPQILFSGFVVSADEMTNAVYYPTQLFPSYAAQTLMDQSIFWRQPIAGGDLTQRHSTALNNLEIQVNPKIRNDEGGINRSLTRVIRQAAANEPPVVYDRAWPGVLATGKLFGWVLLGYGAAWFGLRARERG